MPITWKHHEKSLSEPGLCELLTIRDYLDDVMIRGEQCADAIGEILVVGHEWIIAISEVSDGDGTMPVRSGSLRMFG